MLARIVSIPLTFISPTCYLLSILSILLPSLHTQNLSYHLNGEAPRLTGGQTEWGQTQSYLTDLWPPTTILKGTLSTLCIHWKRHRICRYPGVWWWSVAIRRKCPGPSTLRAVLSSPNPGISSDPQMTCLLMRQDTSCWQSWPLTVVIRERSVECSSDTTSVHCPFTRQKYPCQLLRSLALSFQSVLEWGICLLLHGTMPYTLGRFYKCLTFWRFLFFPKRSLLTCNLE